TRYSSIRRLGSLRWMMQPTTRNTGGAPAKEYAKCWAKQSHTFMPSSSLHGRKESTRVRIAELPSVNSSRLLQDHYRCAVVPEFGLSEALGKSSGFFRFGKDVVCYGQAEGETRSRVNGHLFDASKKIQ